MLDFAFSAVSFLQDGKGVAAVAYGPSPTTEYIILLPEAPTYTNETVRKVYRVAYTLERGVSSFDYAINGGLLMHPLMENRLFVVTLRTVKWVELTTKRY